MNEITPKPERNNFPIVIPWMAVPVGATRAGAASPNIPINSPLIHGESGSK